MASWRFLMIGDESFALVVQIYTNPKMTRQARIFIY
jgi:hypothetical protein